jgi:hypothetical protein
MHLTDPLLFLLTQNATWVTTPELYSTDMRTVGHATCVAFSKLGAFAVPFMVISPASNVTVGIVLCIMNVIGAVASNFLPDTTGMNIGHCSPNLIVRN